MGLEPENVKEQRSARGKWACVYLTENLSGFFFFKCICNHLFDVSQINFSSE